MDLDQLTEIIETNPSIDRTAIDRSRQAAKQLADVGIKLGGYRLIPALGGATVMHTGSQAERRDSSMQQRLHDQD